MKFLMILIMAVCLFLGGCASSGGLKGTLIEAGTCVGKCLLGCAVAGVARSTRFSPMKTNPQRPQGFAQMPAARPTTAKAAKAPTNTKARLKFKRRRFKSLRAALAAAKAKGRCVLVVVRVVRRTKR